MIVLYIILTIIYAKTAMIVALKRHMSFVIVIVLSLIYLVTMIGLVKIMSILMV